MKNFKLIIVLFISIGFTQCKTLKLEKNPSFSVQGATYNYWVGGQPGVSGIKVHIEYQANSKVLFENIYFQNRIAKIETRTIGDKTYIIAHFNTSTREEIIVIEGDKKQKKEVKKPTFPFNLEKNEAVVSYKADGKIKYVKVEKLKKVKTNFFQ